VRGAFLYGASANDFARQLDGLVPVSLNETLDEAVGAALASARSDVSSDTHTILLSPAAASFDQYDSFEARGDAFCARAKQLIASGISEPSGKAVPHA
jgi:UDP-N-acetylmuramoylalanine--D-glutamate ligase